MTLSILVNIVIVLVIVGVLLHLINTYVPMAGSIKSILNILVFIAVLLWILSLFGIIDLQQLRNFRLK